MFAMNLKNRVVSGAANMYSYLGASRSLVGSASLAQEECSQTKLFCQELKNVNIAAHVLTCKKEDGGGLCSVFLLPVTHKHETSIREATYLAERFRPKYLFLEMDDMRYRRLGKKKERCEFHAVVEVSKSFNSDCEVICGDIANDDMMLVQRKLYMERLKKFPFSNPSYQYQRACQTVVGNVRDIYLFNRLWKQAQEKGTLFAMVGVNHIFEIVHMWHLKKLGNMAATAKYTELVEFCKAAGADKGSHFTEVLASYPNISDNLRPFSKKYAKDYVKICES
ncbi:uncharacterized protein LOC123899101 [Trifolium pratense]|uniref:uncharacterized protein LOC123899101 n=1 Tax=Trifolium pratense TaxID=57577 RepID=UPI001E691086|nr:uncharacterized protein LOC123899101 [Trifolium pratense]XP_045806114.1 uncharacterized protein LOC123899101 [Trifolium pratense]